MVLKLTDGGIVFLAIASIAGVVWITPLAVLVYRKCLLEPNGWPTTDIWWGAPGYLTTIAAGAFVGFSIGCYGAAAILAIIQQY